MTPDEDYDTRRIDGLLASFGELMKAEAVLNERANKHDQSLLDMRDMHRELATELRAMVRNIGDVCEGHYRSVESKIDNVEKNIDDRFKAQAAEQRKDRAEREARTMSLWQKVAIAFTVAGVLSSPVILLLGIGPG